MQDEVMEDAPPVASTSTGPTAADAVPPPVAPISPRRSRRSDAAKPDAATMEVVKEQKKASKTAALAVTPHTEEDVEAWRTAQVDERQLELSRIVDRHDDHVRELFHLDRFVTLIGYDPAVAKEDKSDVFTSFQSHFDLFLNAAPEVSGTSSRRGTRRTATDRKSVLAAPKADAGLSSPAATSKRGKGKGKAKVEDTTDAEESTGPQPVIEKKRGGRGRQSLPAPAPVSTPVPKSAKGKRHSLAIAPIASTSSTMGPPSPKRIKLVHLPPTGPPYSHPSQVLPYAPHGGSLKTFLSSYLDISDEAEQPSLAALQIRIEHEAAVLNRLDELKAEGRTLDNPDRRTSVEPKKGKDHQEFLLDHVVYFSKLLNDERKLHQGMGKKISKMILGHFAGLKGKDERLAKEEERDRKALARWTMREVRKKWKLAVNIVKARRKAEAKAERDRIGKQQLNAMLDKSSTMLQAQQVEMAAVDSDTSSDEDSSADEDEKSEAEVETPDRQDSIEAPTPPPVSLASQRRRRQSTLSISATPLEASTPSAHTEGGDSVSSDTPADAGQDEDVVFAPLDDEEERLKEEDDELEAGMEAEDDGGDTNSELGGLAEDADLPIEEIMRRAGYGNPAEEEGAPPGGDVDMTDPSSPLVTRETALSEASASTLPSSLPPLNAALSDVVPESEPSVDPSAIPEPLLPSSTDINGDSIPDAEVMSEFGSGDEDDAVAEEDQELEEAMSAEEGESDDSEMDGLKEDADLSVEELMKKYGYGAAVEEPATQEATPEDGVASPAAEVEADSEIKVAESAVEVSDENASDGEEEEEESSADEEGTAEEEEEVDGSDAGEVVADKPTLRPPFLLRGSLRPYQQAGLEWLASLYTNGVNGILADEMGLGKTIQTISLLAHLACDKGQWGPHLVVVPTSVMLNWEMEFKKFLPGFKILTYYGNQKERKEKRRGWNTENAFHVCVTSYQLVLADQAMFRRKPWHYMILDEAHHIKNFRSQRWQTLLGFNARHRLLLTGTPLQNNLMELWSLLYFLMPHGLMQDGKGPFADHSDFQSWFSNPMERAIESGEAMDEETKATVSKLHTVLRPYLLRRLKSEVETQMPGKTESIIYCRLSKRQRFLYDDFMSRAATRETLGSGHFLSIINCLMQLRKVCNHPDLFEVRPIVTSFAMSRSVASDYEVKELLVRRRLLDEEPMAKMDWTSLTLVRPELEVSSSSIASRVRCELDAGPVMTSLHPLPAKVDLALEPPRDTKSIAGWKKHHEWKQHQGAVTRLQELSRVNTRRCRASAPFFGHELIRRISVPLTSALLPSDVPRKPQSTLEASTILPSLVASHTDRAMRTDELVAHFGCITPKVKAFDMPRHALPGLTPNALSEFEAIAPSEILHRSAVKLSVAFPDRSLLQYDCGKLQKLDELLRECKAGGHRVLIFTQMTKVLDILETFLSFHGHRYLRLDGSTKIEQRQIITERFNSNDRILCFISSTRSGGLGINLQGADTVIFYDSDWNPALDRQCQDRAHRIGQTREVRIWRFVTEHSIEENMLKKANQKRRLDELVIAEGSFTTDYLAKLDWRDYLTDAQLAELEIDEEAPAVGEGELKNALAAAEDEEDAAAARAAEGELQVDQSDFSEAVVTAGVGKDGTATPTGRDDTPVGEAGADVAELGPVEEEVEKEVDPLEGMIDGYMVRFVDTNFYLFDV